jgi:hypothetical protein
LQIIEYNKYRKINTRINTKINTKINIRLYYNLLDTMTEYIVESEVTIRAVDKLFSERQQIQVCSTIDEAYAYIETYLNDTKELHTSFVRQTLCSKEECEERINKGRLIALNVVLGQFEDIIYIVKRQIN